MGKLPSLTSCSQNHILLCRTYLVLEGHVLGLTCRSQNHPNWPLKPSMISIEKPWPLEWAPTCTEPGHHPSGIGCTHSQRAIGLKLIRLIFSYTKENITKRFHMVLKVQSGVLWRHVTKKGSFASGAWSHVRWLNSCSKQDLFYSIKQWMCVGWWCVLVGGVSWLVVWVGCVCLLVVCVSKLCVPYLEHWQTRSKRSFHGCCSAGASDT